MFVCNQYDAIIVYAQQNRTIYTGISLGRACRNGTVLIVYKINVHTLYIQHYIFAGCNACL